MNSYRTETGCLVVRYDPEIDNYDQAISEAEKKHDRIKNVIAVTCKTDFLKHKKREYTAKARKRVYNI